MKIGQWKGLYCSHKLTSLNWDCMLYMNSSSYIIIVYIDMLLYHYVALYPGSSRCHHGEEPGYEAITMCMMDLDMAEALQKPTYTGT